MAKIKEVKIEKEKLYNLLEIEKSGLFPWCRDLKTIRKWIQRDLKEGNKLMAVVYGKKTTTRYMIKGKNITSFVEAVIEKGYLSN